MNTSISKKRREELAPPEPKPVVTVLLVLTAWFLPFIATMAKGDKSVWTGTQGLTANKFFELLSNNDMSGLIGSMLLANFAQLSFWIYLLSAFFIWSFGSVIERIMGNVRFMILALLGIFGGWAILAHEAYAVQPDLPFIVFSRCLFIILAAKTL
jgi:membrane associated rhomboid family serine protease